MCTPSRIDVQWLVWLWNATFYVEQTTFSKTISPDVNSTYLRTVRTDTVKVNRHHELAEVINKEIGEMSGNIQRNEEEAKNIERKKKVEEKRHSKPRCETTVGKESSKQCIPNVEYKLCNLGTI